MGHIYGSCSSEARLFVNAVVGHATGPLMDLSGQPYTALPTAFAYRTAIDPECTCDGPRMLVTWSTLRPEHPIASSGVSQRGPYLSDTASEPGQHVNSTTNSSPIARHADRWKSGAEPERHGSAVWIIAAHRYT